MAVSRSVLLLPGRVPVAPPVNIARAGSLLWRPNAHVATDRDPYVSSQTSYWPNSPPRLRLWLPLSHVTVSAMLRVVALRALGVKFGPALVMPNVLFPLTVALMPSENPP